MNILFIYLFYRDHSMTDLSNEQEAKQRLCIATSRTLPVCPDNLLTTRSDTIEYTYTALSESLLQ